MRYFSGMQITMISMYERYTYVGETLISSFGNLFPDDVPTGIKLFSELQNLFANSHCEEFVQGQKRLKLWKMTIDSSHYAQLLFRLVDPAIPDNELADRTNGVLRTAARKPNEDPAISAHVVVDLRAKHDQRLSYPTCIEKIDFLPRSLVIQYLNFVFGKHLKVAKKRPHKKDTKDFCPRVSFVAPYSHTVAGALDNGGILKGVKWVHEKTVQSTFGDKAYPVFEQSDVSMSVKNRPTGVAAKQILSQVWGGSRLSELKKMTVTIEDENEKNKTIGVDLRMNDILSNLFLDQKCLNNFSTKMPMCEDNIRNEMVSKMKSVLPK
jgi:hypothetical protein